MLETTGRQRSNNLGVVSCCVCGITSTYKLGIIWEHLCKTKFMALYCVLVHLLHSQSVRTPQQYNVLKKRSERDLVISQKRSVSSFISRLNTDTILFLYASAKLHLSLPGLPFSWSYMAECSLLLKVTKEIVSRCLIPLLIRIAVILINLTHIKRCLTSYELWPYLTFIKR